jgi:hypothetical protein
MFDATTGGGLVADNAAVARWQDKSGNAHHATQSTANDRPLVRPNTKAGKPVLEFDGTSDFMRTADANALDLNTFSVFSVVRLSTYTTTSSRNPSIVNKGDYSSAAGTAYELTAGETVSPKWSVGICSGGTFTNSLANGTVASTQNQWALVASRRAAAAAAFVFVNGASSGSTSVISGTLNNVAAGIGIGARGTGTPTLIDLFPGNIAEILVYNFAMSDSQRATVESWLSRKWAL